MHHPNRDLIRLEILSIGCGRFWNEILSYSTLAVNVGDWVQLESLTRFSLCASCEENDDHSWPHTLCFYTQYVFISFQENTENFVIIKS